MKKPTLSINENGYSLDLFIMRNKDNPKDFIINIQKFEKMDGSELKNELIVLNNEIQKILNIFTSSFSKQEKIDYDLLKLMIYGIDEVIRNKMINDFKESNKEVDDIDVK